jgi:hypothetical protein
VRRLRPCSLKLCGPLAGHITTLGLAFWPLPPPRQQTECTQCQKTNQQSRILLHPIAVYSWNRQSSFKPGQAQPANRLVRKLVRHSSLRRSDGGSSWPRANVGQAESRSVKPSQGLSRNDAVKTQKFDKMNRIYRMEEPICPRNVASPFGDGDPIRNFILFILSQLLLSLLYHCIVPAQNAWLL